MGSRQVQGEELMDIPIRFVERTNDGTTSYQVKQGSFYLGKVVNISPGVWGNGSGQEYATRKEAGQALLQQRND